MVVKFTATRRFLLVLFPEKIGLFELEIDRTNRLSLSEFSSDFETFVGSKLQLLARGDELESSWIVRGYLYFGFFIPMESRI